MISRAVDRQRNIRAPLHPFNQLIIEIAPDLIQVNVDELRTEVVMISSSAPLARAIGTLKRKNAYELFICEDSKIGMVNIRDILKTKHIQSRKASSLAISIPALSPRDEISKAAKFMTDYRVRALPIASNGRITGQITALSICSALSSKGKLQFTVDKIMTAHPLTLNVKDPLAKAKTMLNHNNIDHLPVLESGKLVGVLTSQRVLDTLIPPERSMRDKTPETRGVGQLSVRGLMELPLIVNLHDAASSALDKLIGGRRSCALVQFGEELHGILTYRDFVKLLAGHRKPSLPVYIVGLPGDPFEAEMARTKFIRTVKLLSKSYTEILEARATLKTKSTRKSGRKRYEVKASVHMPGRTFAYSATGWDLPKIFDQISDGLKKKMTRRKVSRKG